jgi:hypothetical protein
MLREIRLALLSYGTPELLRIFASWLRRSGDFDRAYEFEVLADHREGKS